MPVVINPIYTRNFPELGRALLDTDIIVIAVTGDDVTYRSTVSAMRTAVGRTFSVSLDSSGEYDFTSKSIREFPCVTIYDSSGNTAPYFYNNTTKKITGGVPSEAITVTFI